jgi:serine/threonine protein phosphatase PrpC
MPVKGNNVIDISMHAQVCAETNIGLKRDQNEDNYLIINRNTKDVDIQNYGMMFAAADGIGGHAAGLLQEP